MHSLENSSKNKAMDSCLCLLYKNDKCFIEGFGIGINIILVARAWHGFKVLVIIINSTTHQ
jgi:hypothetical protein